MKQMLKYLKQIKKKNVGGIKKLLKVFRIITEKNLIDTQNNKEKNVNKYN